jgi:hypothetical protein
LAPCIEKSNATYFDTSAFPMCTVSNIGRNRGMSRESDYLCEDFFLFEVNGLLSEDLNMAKGQTSNLPSTLQRSPAKAQRTYAKTLKSAEAEYGRGARASRTAIAALKHGFEKVGDHWEPKREGGPSDPRAKQSSSAKRSNKGETFGGIDVEGHSKAQLQRRAESLGAEAPKSSRKSDIARAIDRKQRQMSRSAKSRQR